jgi:ribonucleoside-diphosphate reductase alpha chain
MITTMIDKEYFTKKIHTEGPGLLKNVIPFNSRRNKSKGAVIVQLDYNVLELPLIFEEETRVKTRKKIQLTDNAKTVLRARYLRRDLKGEIVEEFHELFERVAQTVAYAEMRYSGYEKMKEYEEIFYNMMANLDFLPNSPTLMNAGTDEGQLSACFVLPVKDSMSEIFEAVKHAALIQKSGGGVGYSFSNLRPAGDRVRTTKGVSSGPISFMRVFNEATETVKQGGKRRGANMGVLRVDHPDILDFINAKKVEGEFFNFNISVGLTDVFMKALKDDTEYDLINPRSGKKAGSLKARDVWNNIVQNAWDKGDPGLLFLDRINKDNPTPSMGVIESTNPCGEACLLPYEACNLGSINLSRFVCNKSIDFPRLKQTIHNAVRFLDDVIDINEYVPLVPKIKEMTKGNRKIGLGIMGFADMLIDMGIPYNDEKAAKVADKVMEFINKEAREASKKLAQERGSFPNWKKSYYYPDTPIRNASITSIAPTGTLSIIAGCSPGIEPLFGVCFERNVLDGNKLLEINPRFEKIARKEGFYSDELMQRVAEAGTIQNFNEIPARVKKLFATAHDVTPEKHLRIQSAFQKHVDMSVSKTINLPFDASPEDIENIYMLSYDLGCKGITVYRSGSRTGQVIVLGKSEGKLEMYQEEIEAEEPDESELSYHEDDGQMDLFDSIPLASPVSSEGEEESDVINIPTFYHGGKEACPECGENTLPVGSCATCPHCGYSKCG